MNIKRYNSGLLDSNMYVIAENMHAIVIDPCQNTSAAGQNIIDYLFITHEHFDHIFGVNIWKELTDAPLICSSKCAGRITDCNKNQARHFDAFCEMQNFSGCWDSRLFDPCYTCEADRTFEESMTLRWQGHQIKMTEIPGHSPGSIGIWIDEYFFSGDSLLEGRDIELRFPGGNKEQWQSKGSKIIAAIPKGTTVYPGHFDSFVL